MHPTLRRWSRDLKMRLRRLFGANSLQSGYTSNSAYFDASDRYHFRTTGVTVVSS
jgi:hypothetical protein